jgi:propanol-preferring alcohol dehydrogenase
MLHQYYHHKALDFASRGLVHCTVHTDALDNINTIFDHLRKGEIEGRVVIQM